MNFGSELATYSVPGRVTSADLRKREGRKSWQKTLK